MSTDPVPPPLKRPSMLTPVRELVAAAGIDVSAWSTNTRGETLHNPNINIAHSSRWAFGGKGEPIALCIWFNNIDWAEGAGVYVGNQKEHQDRLSALMSSKLPPSDQTRLRVKFNRSGAFAGAVYEAYSRQLPIRAIVVDGKQAEIEDAATDSSKTKARVLDPVCWFAHAYDPHAGTYRLVRGIEPPESAPDDPFAALEDPGEDAWFIALIGGIDQTEREALIKLRVGQGPFRDALVKRWEGCSVSGCRPAELLVASHIRPWSMCKTRAERLGDSNGLLLTPNLDKLFDHGLITFSDRFRIEISRLLPCGTALQLGIHGNLRLREPPAASDLLSSLRWHRENVFQRSTS